MKRVYPKSIMASALTAAMVLSLAAPVPVAAEDLGTVAPYTEQEAEEIDWTQAPPLLITEVATDQASGKRYTYTEVYNNSDKPINFKDYTFYYCYERGMGNGQIFPSAGTGNKPAWGAVHPGWGSDGADLYIQPGKTLVLWQSEGTKGNTVQAFNDYYGTNLVENQDIVRIPYSGIHNSAKRGYFFGKDEDSILITAWSNAHGDEIPTGNPDKLAIQYSYPGSGRECVDKGTAVATPGSVTEDQVPAQRVHVQEQTPVIKSVNGEGSRELKVTAKIPYKGTSRAMKVTLHYRQKAGSSVTEYTDYKEVDMVSAGDGETFTGIVPAEQIYDDEIQWYVKASYGPGMSAESSEQTTAVTPAVPDAAHTAPLFVTEVAGSANSDYTYFEVYNQSDQPINLSYYKIFYYYDYPAKTAWASGKEWSLGDFSAILEPGKAMVYWLNNNGKTIEQFNQYYGTDLKLGKDVVWVDYAGLHGTDPRWIRLGTSESDAFTLAGFNQSISRNTSPRKTLQYAYPHGDGAVNESIPVEVSTATPGTVADWQVPSTSTPFQGYANYPADDGNPPTLNVCPTEGLPVPESIREGDWLKVMYDVDFLIGATGSDRLNAFHNGVDPENPENHPGGSEALKNRPYLIGTEILYKLDDAAKWTSVKEKTQWRLGHYLMQIPADVLFGHDKVTFKVRAYTLYGMSETEENTVQIERLNDTKGKVRLNVQDSDLLSGTTTLTANDGGDNANTSIQVDGQPAQQQQNVLEDGAYFIVKTSGMDSYFKNAVTAPYGDNIRDIITIMSPWCELPLSRAIHVDNKYFTYNEATQTYDVTLTIWAGDSGTPFEEIYDVVKNENHEDFQVSGLQLRLANGKDYLPVKIEPDNAKTNTSTALDAWHTIGDSTGMIPHLEATFQIPASEVNAVGYTLDTTALEDGNHVITATSGDQVSTAEVIVDNTAPTIDLGIPQDSVLYAPFVLEAGKVASDVNGIENLAVSLDGKPLTLPATIVPHDLAVGEHTIKVAASDMAGNIATSEIRFKTEEVDPSVTDSNHDGITPTTANLEVSLGEQTADVTFLEGKKLTQENGGIVASEEQGAMGSGANGEFPYQLFTVNAGDVEENDTISVKWNGTASNQDTTHPLNLYVSNLATGSWDLVGTADENGNIQKSFGAKDHVADGKATLMLWCATEGLSPDQAAKASSASLAAENTMSDWDGTGRPESYDFAMAWETDTQYYTESFPYHLNQMNQWIVDHAQDWKIRYVLHTGDIVDDVDMNGEWENADKAMKIFDDAGMPYGVLGGNHDVGAGAEDYERYWKYFGEDRFQDKSYYGGSYKNNLGHYDLLTENGQDLLILYMSWDIYTDEIEWMNQVLQQYPDRKAIIALHRYSNVSPSANLLDYTGKLLQEQVVAKNPNVIAVLNGHYHGASIQTNCFDDDGDGIKERTVYQVCADYQSDPQGGSQYIKFIYFDLANDKVYLNSYSPALNDFNYYDTPKLENYSDGSNAVNQDILELNIDFNTEEKTLTTNSLSADVRTKKTIGSCQGVTGDVKYLWENLEPETQYGWYALVTNARLGETATDVQEFVTEKLPEVVNYTLSASAGKGGSISNAGESQVAEGGTMTYTVTPEAGYRVAQVLVDGQPAELTENTYTFSSVTANHTIEVQFELIPQEEKADLSKLQEAVKQVEGKDLTCYKEETLAELNQLLGQARDLLKNNSLTTADQSRIDQLADELLNALNALPKKPDNGDKDNNSGNNSVNNSNNNGGGNSTSTNNGKKAGAPKTGDTSNTLPYAVSGTVAMLIGLAAAVLLRKRGKHDKVR